MKMFTKTALILTVLATFAPVATHAAPLYAALDIHPVDGISTFPSAVNRDGHVAGCSAGADLICHAFTTLNNGREFIALPIADNRFSEAAAVNDDGDVAGFSYLWTDGSELNGFVTDANGRRLLAVTTRLPAEMSVQGINNLRKIFGGYYFPTGEFRAFIADADGRNSISLGTLGGAYSYAFALNDTQVAVGESAIDGAGTVHAFITGPNGSGIHDLGVLGQSTQTPATSSAFATNASGETVGLSTVDDQHQHAFITGPNGEGMRDLGALGGSYSAAWGINAYGQVVGETDTSNSGQRHAFVTGRNGVGMMDLNELVTMPAGVVLTAANAINDRGQIAAQGSNGHGYLLTPQR